MQAIAKNRFVLVEFRKQLDIIDLRKKPIANHCYMFSMDGGKLYLESYNERTGTLRERILVGHVLGLYVNREQATIAYAERTFLGK